MSPWAAKRPCTQPGCPTLTDTGRCEKHKRQEMRDYNARRGGSTAQGYNATWQRARSAYLHEHPLCTICHATGRLTPATVVDHITPHKGNHDLFWDARNWQALCQRCHSRKTAESDGRWG